MNSTITIGKEYKELVYKGVKKAVDVIALTYGYNGKYVKIDNGDEFKNDITNDGYKVSQQIYSDNPIEDIGCGIIREATKMTEAKMKNGTTTTAIVVGALVKGMVELPNGINILEVKNEIENLSHKVIDYISDKSNVIDNAYDIAFGSCHDDEMAKFVVGMMDKHDEFYETSKTYSNEYKIEYKENKRNVPLKLLHYKGNEEINNPYVVVHHGTIDNTNVIAFSDAIFGWIKDRNTILIVNSINKTASEHIITRMARHDKNIIFFTTHNAESVDFVSNFYKKKVILLADKRLSVDIIGDIDSFSNKGIISGKVQMETASKKIDELKEEISKGHNDHRADIIRKEINDYMGRIYKIYLKSNSYNFEGQNDKFLDVVNDIINLRKSKYKVVHGGGVAFKDAANYILSFKNNETSKEKLLAVDIVSTALYAPINELLARSYTKTNYSDYPDIGIGYNAHGKEKCSMINSGIITPLVSFVNTINIAKDIATEWLLTDASIVVEYNNKEEE